MSLDAALANEAGRPMHLACQCDSCNSSKPSTEGGCTLPDCLCTHCGGVRAAAGGVIVPCTQGGEHCFCVDGKYDPHEGDNLGGLCCWCEQREFVTLLKERVSGHGPHRTKLVKA